MIKPQVIFAALDYDETSGSLRWKSRPEMPNNWNARYAGAEAGGGDHRYRYITLNYERILAHRIAWVFITGAFPECSIDHIDGNGLNNSKANLRSADFVENGRNRKPMASNAIGISGVRRVAPPTRGKPWRASIFVRGRSISLGSFDNVRHAVAARISAEAKYFGEFAPSCCRADVRTALAHWNIETREHAE